MKHDTCPTPDSLHDMLLGKSTAAELEVFSEHLAACSRCTALAAAGAAEDELIASMRIATPVGAGTKELNDAIQRAYTIHSESETMQPPETVVLGESAVTAYEDNLSFDFLGPAQQADELGRLGGYRVVELMGVGGMGMVFRAQDLGLKRQVALKVMMPHVATRATAKERFLREAQAAAAIDHDNVVQIFQVGEDRNIPFIAMQYLSGESLQARQQRGGKLSQAEVLRIGREVAEGLAAAHSKGVIHRDIKPDNIWLEAGRDRAKILDFGLARSHEEKAGLTQAGVVLGTPKYMSPEQAKGETADHRSDLFSLGSVLYHLAAGKPPFSGKNLPSILIAVSLASTEKVEKVAPELQPDLAALINRMLAKEPQDRPQSAQEVATKLADIEAKMADAMWGETLDDHPAVQPFANQVAPPQAKPNTKEQPKQGKTPASHAEPVAKLQAGKGRGRHRVFVLVAAGVLGLLAMFATPTIFRINAGEGTLVLKVTGDDFETALRGKTVKIRNAKTNAQYTIDLLEPSAKQSLQPGDYRFVLTDNSGLKTTTDRFTITSGGDQVVEVYWEPKPERIAEMPPEPNLSPAEASVLGTSAVPLANVEVPTHPTERSVAEYLLGKGATIILAAGGNPVTTLPASDDWHVSYVDIPRDATDDDIRLLQHLPQLQSLNLNHAKASGAAFSDLQQLKLTELTFRTQADVDPHVRELIANFRSLEQLQLFWHMSREDNQSPLSEVWRQMPKLRRLSLYEMQPKVADLNGLSQLPELKELNLTHAEMNEELAAVIAGCPKLKTVNLSGLTDAGLLKFRDSKSLRVLELNDSPISQPILDELREALPECYFSWKGSQFQPLGAGNTVAAAKMADPTARSVAE